MNKPKTMHFTLIFIGLCFFFNPYFAAVDILPDCIGALLVAVGLLPLARLYAPMREARTAFLYLAAIDLVKNILLAFVFGMSMMGEQEVLILIVAFLSATVGVLFAVRAMHLLFDGFYTVASREDCMVLYGSQGGKFSKTERVERFAVIFLVLREVISLLPEFAALLNTTYVDSEMINLYDYIGTMRVLVLIPVLGLGVAYLVQISRYFHLIQTLREFRAALATRYEGYMAEHPGIRIKARHAAAFLLIGIGMLCMTDFYLDFKNIIPDPLGALLLLCGVLLLRLPKETVLPAALSVGVYGVVSAVSSHKAELFSTSYVAADITRSEEVAREYLTMWLSSLLEMLVFLAMLAFLLLALRKTLVKWGGYRPERVDDFEERNEKRVRDELDWQLIKCYIFGFLSALVSFLFDYLKSWPSTRAFRLLEGFWILDFAVALFFAVYTAYTLSLAMGKVKERFQFE